MQTIVVCVVCVITLLIFESCFYYKTVVNNEDEKKSFKTVTHYPAPKITKRNISKSELEEVFKENCTNEYPSDWEMHDVFLNNEEVSFNAYKTARIKKFIEKTANPFEKSKVPVKLQSNKNAKLPDPASRLNNPKEKIDDSLINEELKKEKERLLKLGDADLLQIKEVQEEVQSTTFEVPNIIHYVWFGCRELLIMHYMSVLSAFRYQKPKVILFHTDCEPLGERWKVLKHIIGDRLKVVKRSPPISVWNIPIKVVEHKADVARLQIQMEVGGIYLDTDALVLKPSEDLRKYKMVLGEELPDYLTNAIIFSNRKSWFLRRWYWEYRYFKDHLWTFNAVLVPWSIATFFPDEIHVVKELMCRPHFYEINLIYRELFDWHKHYMLHMISRARRVSDGKAERSLKELAVLNTTFGQISRHVIWGDEKARDLHNSSIACNLTQALLDAYFQ